MRGRLAVALLIALAAVVLNPAVAAQGGGSSQSGGDVIVPDDWVQLPSPLGETILLSPQQAAVVGLIGTVFVLLAVRSVLRWRRERRSGEAHASIDLHLAEVDGSKDGKTLGQFHQAVVRARREGCMRTSDHAMVQKRIEVRRSHLQRNPGVGPGRSAGTSTSSQVEDSRARSERQLAELAGPPTSAAPQAQLAASSSPSFSTPSAQLATFRARHQMQRARAADLMGRPVVATGPEDPWAAIRSELMGGGPANSSAAAFDPFAAFEPDDEMFDPGGMSGIASVGHDPLAGPVAASSGGAAGDVPEYVPGRGSAPVPTAGDPDDDVHRRARG